MNPQRFELLRPTFIENWPPDLAALSIPHVDLPLNAIEVRTIGALTGYPGPWIGGSDPVLIEALKERIDGAVRCFPGGAFVRLGSRSPKDSRYARLFGLRVLHGAQALRVLTEGSRRVANDLRAALAANYEPHVVVRPWIDLSPSMEFRCFVRGRVLVGVSQYHLAAEPATATASIRAAIAAFFERSLPLFHLDDVVVDVFLDPEHPGTVRLLELNPWFEATDSCLFRWRDGGDFDGTFRVAGAPPVPLA